MVIRDLVGTVVMQGATQKQQGENKKSNVNQYFWLEQGNAFLMCVPANAYLEFT
jgi:hypothetical protein